MKRNYSKQQNYCVSLLRKTSKTYYNKLNKKKITDNKTSWTTVKPLLSHKARSNEKTNLIENDMIKSLTLILRLIVIPSFLPSLVIKLI